MAQHSQLARRLAFAAVAMAAAFAVGATVFQWVDDKGVTHYGDAPPEGVKARPVELAIAPGAPASPADWKKLAKKQNQQREAEKYYEIVRDFLRAAEKAWGEAWGSASYMVTRPVTIKAMLRVCADLAREDAEPKEERVKRWSKRLAPWGDLVKQFRGDGFYERFPAKGQVERVARVHRDLARAAGIERRGKTDDSEE